MKFTQSKYTISDIYGKGKSFSGDKKKSYKLSISLATKSCKLLFISPWFSSQYSQVFPTHFFLPSLLMHLPHVCLGKRKHMLWQIYSCSCADCPSIRVCWLASWLLHSEVNIGLDCNGFSFQGMLMKAFAITRRFFS